MEIDNHKYSPQNSNNCLLGFCILSLLKVNPPLALAPKKAFLVFLPAPTHTQEREVRRVVFSYRVHLRFTPNKLDKDISEVSKKLKMKMIFTFVVPKAKK